MSRFVHLLVLETLLQFGVYLMNPIVSGYAVVLGASVALAGFVAGLNATMAIFVRPVSGLVSDRFNKKVLLIGSCVVFMASAWGCALATTPFWLGVFRALQGVSFAFKSAIVVSLVALVVPRSSVGGSVGLLGLAFTVACALGPFAGERIALAVGYRYSFLLASALFAVALALALTFREPESARAHRTVGEGAASGLHGGIGGALRHMVYGPAVPYALTMAFFMVAQGVAISLMLLVADLEGVRHASLYFVVYAVVSLVSKPLAGRASDRYGVRAVVIPMSIVAAAGMAVLAFDFSLPFIVVAAVCMGVGHGSVFSSVQAESVRGVGADKVGRSANVFYLGSDVGMGLGPFLGASVLQAAGTTALFLFSCACIALGLAVFIALCRSPR